MFNRRLFTLASLSVVVFPSVSLAKVPSGPEVKVQDQGLIDRCYDKNGVKFWGYVTILSCNYNDKEYIDYIITNIDAEKRYPGLHEQEKKYKIKYFKAHVETDGFTR